jgi:hypothetical protein
VFSLSPLAVKLNRTTPFFVSTSFSSGVNYGSGVEYFCDYGTNITVVRTSASITDGKFSCTVIMEVEGKAQISISMKTKGIEKLITLNETFNVVSKILNQFNSKRCKFL